MNDVTETAIEREWLVWPAIGIEARDRTNGKVLKVGLGFQGIGSMWHPVTDGDERMPCVERHGLGWVIIPELTWDTLPDIDTKPPVLCWACRGVVHESEPHRWLDDAARGVLLHLECSDAIRAAIVPLYVARNGVEPTWWGSADTPT